MLFKWLVIFHKGLEILPVFHHVVGCILSVPVVVPHVAIQLIPKCTKQAVSKQRFTNGTSGIFNGVKWLTHLRELPGFQDLKVTVENE